MSGKRILQRMRYGLNWGMCFLQKKPGKTLLYKEAMGQFEREILKDALSTARDNQSELAKIMGVSRNFLIRRL